MHSNFSTSFHTATGHSPYAYQCRLACGEGADPNDDVNSRLRNGLPLAIDRYSDRLGQDGAVVLGWLWNRVSFRHSTLNSQLSTQSPRRLVYCLPMRTLVEQTESENPCVRELARHLNSLGRKAFPSGNHDGKTGVHILMGGEETRRLGSLSRTPCHPHRHPGHAPLSRAQPRLRHEPLSLADALRVAEQRRLWVIDETQLMGVGMDTSAQLEAFRKRLGAWGAASWWMSATLDEARVQTVDQRALGRKIAEISVSADESARLARRLNATKRLTDAPVSLDPPTKKNYARELARFVVEKAAPDALTLVILNRVGRAQETYRQLLRFKPPAEQIALIHSRFRRGDERKKHERLLFGKGRRIVVATQAIEAGVDVSARVLITELAPWSSLVQRLGRCNRYGVFVDGADAYWIDLQPKDARDDIVLPYRLEELDEARRLIAPLREASIARLRSIAYEQPRVIRPVIRRRDLLDLFDTTPDIAGQDLDVSRYIRDGEDNDVQVFWRVIEGDEPAETHGPHPQEICRVSIGAFAAFANHGPDGAGCTQRAAKHRRRQSCLSDFKPDRTPARKRRARQPR